jgi:bla regulator protein blaR1
VIDKTGLAGAWNYWFHYAPDRSQGPGGSPVGADQPAPDPNLVSYEQALREQLGLKLESSRGSVEVLVIDSVQQPTEN